MVKLPNRLQEEQGIVMMSALFFMVALLSITGAGLIFASLNLKSTSSLKTGTATLQVADAAILHAVALIPLSHTFQYTSETTILDCQRSIECTDGSLTPFGGEYAYTVKAINDPATPDGTRAVLTATAMGPNQAKKVVVAYIERQYYSWGAMSLPGSLAENAETQFMGDIFTINGNDRCNANPPVPAIMVTDPDLAKEIANDGANNAMDDGGLSVQQMDNIIGPGANASIRANPPPEKTVLEYASDYLALTDLVDEKPGGTYGGLASWGTSGSPRITHLTGDARIAGTINGHGVLVVDGTLHVTGDLEFNGLVIMRGDGQIRADGNARIYGAVLIVESTSQDGGFELDIRGMVNIQYDSCTLLSADGWVPLPLLTNIVAWQQSFTD